MMHLNWKLAAALGAGLVFLYVPIAVVIVFSFNESRLVSVWTGFSLRWYETLLADRRILEAAALSVMIAAISASIATILGALAGYALTRFSRSWLRALLAGLAATPLVMPEVLMGLALLLLYVGIDRTFGWPGERGPWAVVIAHATLSIAYAALVIQARLAGIDRAIEEAAIDLGATPMKAFVLVVMPLLAPALLAAWLLAFTLSFDDLVIASFVAGPGATTLPMVVFSNVRLGLSPEINALGTVFVAVAALAAGGAYLLIGRRQDAG